MANFRSAAEGPEGCGKAGCLIMIFAFLFGGTVIGGWVTHIIHCFRHHDWGFLIAGALAFPIGVVHGWGIWFHWW